MKINEIIVLEETIDEGLGSVIGKTAGHVVGGLKAFGRDVKKGYQDAKGSWDDSAQTAPAASTGSASGATAGGTAPASSLSGTGAPTGSASGATAGGTAPASSLSGTGAPTGSASGVSAPAATGVTAASNRVAAGQAKQEVDQAVASVQKVRSRDRQNVVAYAKDKLDAISAQPAATTAAPAASTATTPAVPPADAASAVKPTKSKKPSAKPAAPAVTPPEDDNPNLVRGYNEEYDRVVYLSKLISR